MFEGIKEFFKIKPIKVVCDGGDKVYRGDYIFGGVTNSLSVGEKGFDFTLRSLHPSLLAEGFSAAAAI